MSFAAAAQPGIYLSDLPEHTNELELRDIFTKHAAVSGVHFLSELSHGKTSAVVSFQDEGAVDQVLAAYPDGRVEVRGVSLDILPKTHRTNISSRVTGTSLQQQPEQPPGGGRTAAAAVQDVGAWTEAVSSLATAAATAAAAVTPARQKLAYHAQLPQAAAAPLQAAPTAAADISSALELSPQPPMNRSQHYPVTPTSVLAAPTAAMAQTTLPWGNSSSSSSTTMTPNRALALLRRERTASATPTAAAAAAAGMAPSSVIRTPQPSRRPPPGFAATPIRQPQLPIESQQGYQTPQQLSSRPTHDQLQEQQQQQQYIRSPYPPRPAAPEPPSPPAGAAAAAAAAAEDQPSWPIQPFEHHQQLYYATNPGSHYLPHFNHPTTLADRDAAHVIARLEFLRQVYHKLSHCLVCVSAPRSVVLLPCKHLAVCESCAGKMKAVSEGRLEAYGQQAAWVNFDASTEAQAAAVAAAAARKIPVGCPVCGAGVEKYIGGVQLPGIRKR